MKAIVQSTYGSPDDVLVLQDIDKPAVGDGDVLVRVHAASVHLGDWVLMTGVPRIMRLSTGLRAPKHPVPGTDIAGTVEAIGKDVTKLHVGDEVFGYCDGAFAEYASAPEDHFVPKPAGLSFEQAAAVGVSATTALQLLRDQGKVKQGQSVLINGASGGVGPFAVQIAKAFGAEVTGVCSTTNVDMVRSIGADQVIDYTETDFTKGGSRYDFILDNVGDRPRVRCQARAHPERAPPVERWGPCEGRPRPVIKTAFSAMFSQQQLAPSLKKQNPEDLVVLKDLVDAGKITPVIDGTYPLSATSEAIDHVAEGHARGTAVITI